MTQTRPNGIKVPTNSDEYKLTADLADMADSINVAVLVANTAARDALTKYVGLTVTREDARGWQQVWDGTKWYAPAPFAKASGYVNVPNVPAAGTATGAFTFPVGLFTQPPVITLTPESYRLTAGVSAPTTLGTTAVCMNPSTAATGQVTRVHWTATQASPDSAVG